MSSLAKIIRTARDSERLTQAQLASIAGVGERVVRSWESGQTQRLSHKAEVEILNHFKCPTWGDFAARFSGEQRQRRKAVQRQDAAEATALRREICSSVENIEDLAQLSRVLGYIDAFVPRARASPGEDEAAG